MRRVPVGPSTTTSRHRGGRAEASLLVSPALSDVGCLGAEFVAFAEDDRAGAPAAGARDGDTWVIKEP